MSITATFDHRARRVTARAAGPVTLEEIRQHLEEERQEPGLSYSELFDARGAIPEFAPADVRVIVALLRWLGEKTKLGPTAVVVDSDFAYGMVRIVEMLVEDVCAVKPFRSESDAESWLESFHHR
jgi:hypothetical protein